MLTSINLSSRCYVPKGWGEQVILDRLYATMLPHVQALVTRPPVMGAREGHSAFTNGTSSWPDNRYVRKQGAGCLPIFQKD